MMGLERPVKVSASKERMQNLLTAESLAESSTGPMV